MRNDKTRELVLLALFAAIILCQLPEGMGIGQSRRKI